MAGPGGGALRGLGARAGAVRGLAGKGMPFPARSSAAAEGPSPGAGDEAGHRAEGLEARAGAARGARGAGAARGGSRAGPRGGRARAGGGAGAGGPGGEPHLLVFVHGLFGRPRDWRHVVTELRRSGAVGAEAGVRVLVSSSNRRTGTFDGVDRCGERLAREVAREVDEHPELASISFVGHSLGGLIARYAAGVLLDEGSGPSAAPTVARLRPELFCTIVTPHLGCDPAAGSGAGGAAEAARVPFLEWVGSARGLGPPFQSLASVAAAPTASFFLGRTGAQLFLRDRGRPRGAGPLLVEMAGGGGARGGERGDGAFLRALSAFRARVAYANVQGDHMVGWPNASLRRCSELPQAAVRSAAWPAIVLDTAPTAAPPGLARAALGAGGAAGAAAGGKLREEHLREQMLCGLQSLAWRRVDVGLETQLAQIPPAVPHNHIQARPPNTAGLLTTRHLGGVLHEILGGGGGGGDGGGG